jgi:murein DD-endopeptidase MepM/ murein hydrolase activator NlpD
MKKSKFLLIFVSICILGLFLYLLASKAARNSVKGVNADEAFSSSNQDKDIEFVKPVKKGFVASSFGWRKNPFTGKKEFHKGIDIAAPKGAEVYAAAEGTVVSAVSDYEPDSVPGKHVLIMHSKKIKTFYSKLDSVLVKEGQTVKAGELIGKIGTSGVSKGPHLHFEVLVDDVAQNPAKYIGSKR